MIVALNKVTHSVSSLSIALLVLILLVLSMVGRLATSLVTVRVGRSLEREEVSKSAALGHLA